MRDRLKAIISIVFSISAILIILELFFRFFFTINFQTLITHSTKEWPDGDTFLDCRVARLSNTLGYEWMPNIKNGWLHTNSLGMRDRERQAHKSKGTYRIICLGDSTTANSEYVRILEKMLNNNKRSQDYEVWNCAVTGYNIVQYCRALKEKWLKFDPDMVIIGFCLNDFSPTPLVVKENNRLVGFFPEKEVLPMVSPFFLKHSALYRFVAIRLFFSKNVDYYKEMIQMSRQYLQETKELLSTKNIRFLIVILGLTKRFEDSPKPWKDNYIYIKQIIHDYHFDSLDIVPLFQQNNPESLMSHDELHFNRQGSQIVAEAIYNYLKQGLKQK